MKVFLVLGLVLVLNQVPSGANASDNLSAPFHSKAAVDVNGGGLAMQNRDELRNPPITIECWARFHNATSYNIVVASDIKTATRHWELYTSANEGYLAFYTSGMGSGVIPISTAPVCDDAWHYLAVIYEPTRARLYVDGKMVQDIVVPPGQGTATDSDIAVGQLVEGGAGVGFGCAGLIQDIRISKGVREITGTPTGPFTKDAATLALWNLNR